MLPLTRTGSHYDIVHDSHLLMKVREMVRGLLQERLKDGKLPFPACAALGERIPPISVHLERVFEEGPPHVQSADQTKTEHACCTEKHEKDCEHQ